MTTSVQLAQSTDDLCHVGKAMPSIKPTVLYTTGKLRKDSKNTEASSKYGSAKDIVRALSRDSESFTALNELQNYRPILNHSRNNRKSNLSHPPSPLHVGVSEECIAMANACSHDHDYSVASLEVCTPRTKSENKEIYRRQSLSPGIIIKREPEEVIDLSTLGGAGEITRTPRAPNRIRPRRIVLVRKGSIDLKTLTCKQKQCSNESDIKPGKNDADECIAKTDDTIVLKADDVIIPRRKNRDSSFTLLTTGSSKESCNLSNCDVTSPRPSITPFPPAERRRSRRGSATLRKKVTQTDGEVTSGIQVKQEPENLDDSSGDCKESVDSAYNSLTCSSTSQPRTPSGNRPASGGKRSATCGLTSSSSSGASSDEWSDLESPRQPGVASETHTSVEDITKDGNSESLTGESCAEDKSRLATRRITLSPRHRKITSGKKSRKQSSRIISSTTRTEETKTDEKIQYVPTPPTRKPKKGKYYRSVPMRLRALPTSFWEEPNRINASPYTILPPVHALFHQQENADIADIRPVTPPSEKETARQTISAAGACDRTRNRTIIRTGDTDLLLRLFDKVEAKQNQTGIRPKRGRPKRPSYCAMPSSRRADNDNPYIIDSITEKLFPKLSLDHRYPLAAMVTSSSSLPVRSGNVDVTTEESRPSNAAKFNPVSSDVASNMLLTDDDSPSSSLNFSADVPMDMMSSSPSPTLQPRPSPILPQLVMQKEYPQLLNELASVL